LQKIVGFLRRAGAKCFNLLQDTYLASVTRGMNVELARRNAKRGEENLRWFTPEEAAVAEALAAIIVPSDKETPGIEDVGVLGPPAIVALDNLVVKSPYSQDLYLRGLLSFDIWAQSRRGCKFAELPKEDQIMLFRAAQHNYERWTAGGSGLKKAWRRLRAISPAKNGSFFAAQLYPQLRGDCLRVFYTSRVSWTWLQYDGPPMDKGYSSLATPRED
jgi:Gluconate 2-dehydrogenase subunit 3